MFHLPQQNGNEMNLKWGNYNNNNNNNNYYYYYYYYYLLQLSFQSVAIVLTLVTNKNKYT